MGLIIAIPVGIFLMYLGYKDTLEVINKNK